MSKSLGNVSNLLDLIDIYDPRAYRMVLLQSHYRSPVKITSDSIDAAINSLAGLDCVRRPHGQGLADDTTSDPEVLAEFRAAMDDDLDTPRATALIFDTVRRANAALDAGDAAAAALAAAVHEICDAVGLELGVAGDVPADVARLGDRARRGPCRTRLRPCRRDPRRAAGRRLDRRDDQRRYDDSPVTDTIAPPDHGSEPPLEPLLGRPRRADSTRRGVADATARSGWATSRRSTGCAPCRSCVVLLLPRRILVDARRLLRRRGVLRRVGVPDHVAAARGARPPRQHLVRRLLDAARPAAAAGALRRARRGRRCGPRSPARPSSDRNSGATSRGRSSTSATGARSSATCRTSPVTRRCCATSGASPSRSSGT